MEKINRRVYLKLTNGCNRQCSFCYYAGDPKPIGEMPLDLVKDIVQRELEIHEENTYLRVILSGGEPTLCTNLEQILDYLSKKSIIRIVLETNGTNVNTPEFLNILNYFKFKNFLKISIYSELFAADENYATNLIEFIQLAKQAGIKYLLNPRYKDEVEKQQLKTFIEENNLAPDFGEVYYYPIYDCNFYRDKTLPTYNFSFITYDYDGKVLLWHESDSDSIPMDE